MSIGQHTTKGIRVNKTTLEKWIGGDEPPPWLNWLMEHSLLGLVALVGLVCLPFMLPFVVIALVIRFAAWAFDRLNPAKHK
jgi:hypothetical protein